MMGRVVTPLVGMAAPTSTTASVMRTRVAPVRRWASAFGSQQKGMRQWSERVPQGGEVTRRTADKAPTSPVHTLPPDVLAIVFGFVDVKTLLLSVHRVCRSWRVAMAIM
jgi:hypothetical protein